MTPLDSELREAVHSTDLQGLEEGALLRARHDRDVRNAVEVTTGYLCGTYLVILGASVLVWNTPAIDWVQTGKGVGYVAAGIVFLRFGLPWFARLFYNDERARRSRGWRRIHFVWLVVVVGVIVVAATVISVQARGILPVLIVAVPKLTGGAGALLWAGTRWSTGDAPMCARCGYPWTAADVCPECGSRWGRKWGLTLGERKVRKDFLRYGAACGVLFVLVVVAAVVVGRQSLGL